MELEAVCKTYGITKGRLASIEKNFPKFSGYDHPGSIKDLAVVYGVDEGEIKEAILTHPPFVGYDHNRVLDGAISVYGGRNLIKSVILRHPQLAGRDQLKTVDKITEVYGNRNRSRVMDAILDYPAFAGYDHKRVVRQKSRVAAFIGFPKSVTVDHLLDKSVNAGYNFKRDFARMDVAYQLSAEGYNIDYDVITTLLNKHMVSPYVPGTKTRLSRAKKMLKRDKKNGIIGEDAEVEDPQLLVYMRQKLDRLQR